MKLIPQWLLPNISPWNCSIQLDHICEATFQYFLFYPSFYQHCLCFIRKLIFIFMKDQLQLLTSIKYCNTCNDLMSTFSILKIVSITQNTFWMFLCRFGSSLVKSTYINSYHLCPNISILICMELLKICQRHYIIPFIWTYRTFLICLRLFLKNEEDDVSFMYRRSNYLLSTNIFNTLLNSQPNPHYSSVEDQPFKCFYHIF